MLHLYAGVVRAAVHLERESADESFAKQSVLNRRETHEGGHAVLVIRRKWIHRLGDWVDVFWQTLGRV